MVSLREAALFHGLAPHGNRYWRPNGANKVALRAADTLWLGLGDRALTLPVRTGETGGSRWLGPECGFWLIVAVGGAETDSGCGFRPADGREVISGVGFAGILRNLRVAVTPSGGAFLGTGASSPVSQRSFLSERGGSLLFCTPLGAIRHRQ
jgi:hypothetical protein